ncbi:MAG: hypothetical protein AAB510_01840 [Patescibacteria group bacterium]
MIDSIEWLRVLIENYHAFQYVIIFIAAVLGGELMIFVFGFLVAQGVISILPVILITFVGAFLPNLLWFLLGRTNGVHKISSHKYTLTTVSSIVEGVEKMSRGNHVIALIIIKFLVGTPVLLTLYSNRSKLSLSKFIYAQLFAVALSIVVIMFLGYLSGRGFLYITEIFKNLYSAIGFILLVLVLIFGVQIWFEKLFTNRSKN